MLRLPLILLAILGLAATATAEPRVEATDGTEITRDPAEIDTLLADPVDPDFLDTALVFHNASDGPAIVGCAGLNRNGRGLGRGHVKIPPHGVRHLLASDLSDGVDFVGSAHCVFRQVRPDAASLSDARRRDRRGRVIGTGFIVAPSAVTRAPARHRGYWIKFPVVAHR